MEANIDKIKSVDRGPENKKKKVMYKLYLIAQSLMFRHIC